MSLVYLNFGCTDFYQISLILSGLAPCTEWPSLMKFGKEFQKLCTKT